MLDADEPMCRQTGDNEEGRTAFKGRAEFEHALDEMVAYVGMLQSVDTAEVEPLIDPVDEAGDRGFIFREDEVVNRIEEVSQGTRFTVPGGTL